MSNNCGFLNTSRGKRTFLQAIQDDASVQDTEIHAENREFQLAYETNEQQQVSHQTLKRRRKTATLGYFKRFGWDEQGQVVLDHFYPFYKYFEERLQLERNIQNETDEREKNALKQDLLDYLWSFSWYRDRNNNVYPKQLLE